jgi:hypothetical protein
MWSGKEQLLSWQPAGNVAKPYPAPPAPGAAATALSTQVPRP